MNEARKRKMWEHLWGDAAVIAVSIIFSLYWLKTGAVERLIDSVADVQILGMLIAGMLFTSVFTTAPAIIFIGKLGQTEPLILVAFVGALGALLGDAIIFRFVKDSLVQDMETLVSLARPKRLRHIFHLKFFRWFTTFMGALVIVSPLPDELGITLMGFAKTDSRVFAAISFVMNFIGIVAIVLLARAITL